MPRRTATPPTYDKSRKRWKVTIPASLSPDGKRMRSWHLTREAARTHLDKLTGSPEPSAIIAPRLAMQADEAREILEPWKIGLVDGAKMLARAMEALAGVGSILDAAKLYASQHADRAASKTFGEAIPLFLQTRDGLREDTLRGYKHHLNRVLATLHDRTLSDITSTGIDEVLAPRPPSMRKACQVSLGAFWRWCASPPRTWCKVEVLDALEPVRLSRDTEIQCLTAESARAVLKAAEATSPGCAIGFAVAIFGGVRLRELEKLTWENIGETHIEITALVAKRHARRLIPICPTLKAWFSAHRGDAEADDLVVGPNWVNTSKIARRKAGWNLTTQPPLKNAPPITRGSWPKNVMRHTCASIQVAIGRPLEELTFAFGHSGGSSLLKQHYLAKLTKKEALDILAIGPGGKKIVQHHRR